MAWGASTGTVAAANNKAASTTLTTGAVTCPIGDQIILMVAADNTGTALPTISSITVPGGETATWKLLASCPSSSNTAAAGVVAYIYGITPTQTWTAFSPVVTFSASITAKSSHGFCMAGGSLNLREVPPRAGTSIGATAGSSITNTLVQSGDLTIGMIARQTATAETTTDTDTTNGSWAAQLSSGTTGGTDNTNIVLSFQTKVATGTGTQTYDTSNTAAAAGTRVVLALTPAGTTTQQVSRVHAEALVMVSPALQVSRAHAEALILQPAAIQIGQAAVETLYAFPDRKYGSLQSVIASESGSFATSNTTVWSSSIPSLAVYPAFAGETLVVAVCCDNASGTTPTLSMNKPANETASWTNLVVNSPQAAAGAGVTVLVSFIRTTVPWTYTPSFVLSGTLSNSVGNKAWTVTRLLGVLDTAPSWLSTGQGTATGTLQPATGAPTGTPRIGDFMLVVSGSEDSGTMPTTPNTINSFAVPTAGVNKPAVSIGYMTYDGTAATASWTTNVTDGGVIIVPLAYSGAWYATTWDSLVGSTASGSLAVSAAVGSGVSGSDSPSGSLAISGVADGGANAPTIAGSLAVSGSGAGGATSPSIAGSLGISAAADGAGAGTGITGSMSLGGSVGAQAVAAAAGSMAVSATTDAGASSPAVAGSVGVSATAGGAGNGGASGSLGISAVAGGVGAAGAAGSIAFDGIVATADSLPADGSGSMVLSGLVGGAGGGVEAGITGLVSFDGAVADGAGATEGVSGSVFIAMVPSSAEASITADVSIAFSVYPVTTYDAVVWVGPPYNMAVAADLEGYWSRDDQTVTPLDLEGYWVRDDQQIYLLDLAADLL